MDALLFEFKFCFSHARVRMCKQDHTHSCLLDACTPGNSPSLFHVYTVYNSPPPPASGGNLSKTTFYKILSNVASNIFGRQRFTKSPSIVASGVATQPQDCKPPTRDSNFLGMLECTVCSSTAASLEYFKLQTLVTYVANTS